MTNNTLLITGLPRSGTSLITALLHDNIKSVAFSEPEWLKPIRIKSDTCVEFTHLFTQHIQSLRNRIKNGGSVSLKLDKQNKIITNYYIRSNNNQVVTEKAERPVFLPSDYASSTFIIKANTQFTSCIKHLLKLNNSQIVCVVRDPLAVIKSWRSLDIPISKGKLAIAEKYYPGVFPKGKIFSSLLEKQVYICDWFFEQYSKHADQITLVKYEDLIAETKAIIQTILGCDANNIPELTTKNISQYYKHQETAAIQSMIQEKSNFIKQFYPQ